MATLQQETDKNLDELKQLVQRAGQGSQEAKLALFQKYGRHLLMIDRQRLKLVPRLRSLYDPDEFVQDVAKDFFAGELPAGIFESSLSLYQVLDKGGPKQGCRHGAHAFVHEEIGHEP